MVFRWVSSEIVFSTPKTTQNWKFSLKPTFLDQFLTLITNIEVKNRINPILNGFGLDCVFFAKNQKPQSSPNPVRIGFIRFLTSIFVISVKNWSRKVDFKHNFKIWVVLWVENTIPEENRRKPPSCWARRLKIWRHLC